MPEHHLRKVSLSIARLRAPVGAAWVHQSCAGAGFSWLWSHECITLSTAWCCRRQQEQAAEAFRRARHEAHAQRGEESGEEREANLCVICLDHSCDTVFTQCGHLCVCHGCALQMTSCPMCRTPSRVMRVYSV